MKHYLSIIYVLVASCFLSSLYAAENFSVNKSLSQIEWVGEKVTGQHNGIVQVKSGSLQLEKGTLTNGTIVVDMDSITVSDIKDANTNKQLVSHLRSEDFFSVDKFKEAKLTIKNFSKTSDKNYQAKGELTIKDKTHPVDFLVSVADQSDKKLEASGTLKVDRTLWDIRYGSGKFFEKLGDKMINDVFTLKFKIVASL